MYGPVDIKSMPLDAKVSGMMTKVKSSGAVRVILNLSAPLGQSVNEGISSEDYPTLMSSTKRYFKFKFNISVVDLRCLFF